MAGILQQVSEQFDRMTASHQKVAQFLLGHPNDVAFLNLDDTARLAEVSTTSVIRFARTMGFEGFKNFQREIQRELKGLVAMPDRFSKAYNDIPKDELILRTVKNDIQNISRTIEEIPDKTLQKAVQMISGATRVYIMGMRESHALAHYMLTRLVSLRKYVSLLPAGFDEMPEQVMSLDRSDVCIYFLFNRYTRRSVELLSQLHDRGVQIILMTDPDYGDLSNLADLVLPCYMQGISLKNSSAAAICLVNCLANAVAASDYDRSMHFLSETAQILDRNGILY